MSVGKTIDGVQKKVTDFVKKNWEEMQAQNAQNEARKKKEQEAFNKSYHSERLKLKTIEGRIRAQEEVGVTVPANKGEVETAMLSRQGKETTDSGHPITNPKTLDAVMKQLVKT